MTFRQNHALAGIAALLLATPASANLLTNGSFEQPVLSSLSTNLGYYTNGNTSMPGWTVDMRPGSTSTWVQLTANSAFPGLSATQGVQFLDLTGITGRGAGVRTGAIATDATLDYRLAFDLGAVFYNGSFGAATLDLLINGSLAGSYTVQPPASNSINWQRFSHDFAGTGSPVTIGLYASFSTASSNLGVALDNVTLESMARPPVPPPPVPGVPEPSSWLMLIAGFGLIGAWQRRAHRSAARPA